MNSRPWEPDEIAWAKECLTAGDSIEEIAATAGRPVDDVIAHIGSGKRITPKAREVLQLYAAGLTLAEIDIERGQTTGRPGSAAAALLLGLRRRGVEVPYRRPTVAVLNSKGGR